MLNPPNSLSLLRAPLALLFIIDHAMVRAGVVLLAMLTDCIDGYLARRYQATSRFGAILDPLMDKFFVYVALVVLIYDRRIGFWEMLAMLSRDVSLFLYIAHLWAKKNWKQVEYKAIRWGKITTATQFCFLTLLALRVSPPSFCYLAFVFFGVCAFFELVYGTKMSPKQKHIC